MPMTKAWERLTALRYAENLSGVDEIQIGDVVRLGYGVHAHTVVQRDAIQVLATDDGVMPAAAIGGRRPIPIVELPGADLT